MDARVVELDALAYPVRAAAEYHYLLLARYGHGVLAGAVCRIVIRGILNAADRHRLIPRGLAERDPAGPYLVLPYTEELREVPVGETELLRFYELLVG